MTSELLQFALAMLAIVLPLLIGLVLVLRTAPRQDKRAKARPGE